jgi:hypothetical protein
MKLENLSPTYLNILDLLFKTKLVSRKQYATVISNNSIQRVDTGHETTQATEDFFMNASALWSQCTPHEWHLVGRIGVELKRNCALWECDASIKKNSSTKAAIRKLIERKVLFKTETTDIYLVNPIFIRRGDVATVLYTTAAILQDVKKVNGEVIKGYKAVDEYKPLLTEADMSLFYS